MCARTRVPIHLGSWNVARAAASEKNRIQLGASRKDLKNAKKIKCMPILISFYFSLARPSDGAPRELNI